MELHGAKPNLFNDAFFNFCKNNPEFLKRVLSERSGSLLNQYSSVAFKVPNVLEGMTSKQFYNLLEHLEKKSGFKNLLLNVDATEAQSIISAYKQIQNNESLARLVNQLDDEFIAFVAAARNSDFLAVYVANRERVKAWKVLREMPVEVNGNPAFLDRMLDDLADHTDFDVFVRQGDNAQKWTVINSASINAESIRQSKNCHSRQRWQHHNF